MKKWILILLHCLLLTACHLRPGPKSSVLVIGVESLGFDVVSCGADPYLSKDLPGFATFCEESVRFTHAYTPSTLSQATWTALLTATYPFENGVHHNGAQFLSARFETVAEKAVRAKYRTAFFSGGPPVFRKSGLAQGFELFDDSFVVQKVRPYRPARETFEHFLNWLGDEVEGDAFFAAVHVADLQFPEISTVSANGELRERSFSSQVREVGESLGLLIARLKKLKRWESTTLVLVGLNGPGPINELHSQSTQVALFFKPQRQQGQEPREWKIDRSVSLVDVGLTLADLLGVADDEDDDSDVHPHLQVVSLAPLLETPEIHWSNDRGLISETAWSEWRSVGTNRAALRTDPFLFLFDRSPKIFNTLVDRLEVSPFPARDPRTLEQEHTYRRRMEYFGFEPARDLHPERLLKLRTQRSNDLAELERLGFWGPAAQLAVQEHDWSALERLGHKSGEGLWQYVALRNLGKRPVVQLQGCGPLFMGAPANEHECADRLFLSLLAWIRERRESEKRQLQERFLGGYMRELLMYRIGRLNAGHLWPWDTDMDSVNDPSLTELFLSLPENKMYLTIAKSRSLKEDGAINLRPSLEF